MGKYENKALWDIMVNLYKSMTYNVIENGRKWIIVELSD